MEPADEDDEGGPPPPPGAPKREVKNEAIKKGERVFSLLCLRVLARLLLHAMPVALHLSRRMKRRGGGARGREERMARKRCAVSFSFFSMEVKRAPIDRPKIKTSPYFFFHFFFRSIPIPAEKKTSFNHARFRAPAGAARKRCCSQQKQPQHGPRRRGLRASASSLAQSAEKVGRCRCCCHRSDLVCLSRRRLSVRFARRRCCSPGGGRGWCCQRRGRGRQGKRA